MMKKNFIFPSIIGNALEYYDFTIFAVFSAQIGALFFPKQDEFSSILSSLAVFAVGFLMRPLGAILFGHIGDKSGRKKALTLSIACMAIPTFLIGIIPGYEVLGIWAPVLLVLLRLIQGLSIGGEGAGSAIFILEHNQNLKPGVLGGIITASNFIGAFLATLLGFGISKFSAFTYGWRYAFILGGLLGLVGFYLRIRTKETPVFNDLIQKEKIVKQPLLKALKINKREMILSGCLGGLAGAFAYMILAYLNLLFSKILGFSASLSLIYAAVGIGSFIFFLPLLGLWSDKVGHLRSIIQGCMLNIILLAPLYMMISFDNQILLILSVITIGALGAWVCAPAYPVMLAIFPPEQRYSGIAFSFNMGIAIFGGTSPIISGYLTKITSLIYAPSFYLIAISILFCCCYFWFSRTHSLNQELLTSSGTSFN